MICQDRYTYLGWVSRCRYDGGLTAAIVGSAVAAAGTGANIAIQGKMNRRSERQAQKMRDFQREEREAQNEWNLEQWNRQNEKAVEFWNMQNDYNSPTAQRERMEAAGYSPLGAVGQSSEAGMPQASEAASASDPSSAMPQYANPLANFDTFGGIKAALEYKDLLLKEKEIDAKIDSLTYDKRYKQALTDTENALRDGKVALLGVQYELGKAQASLTRAERKKVAHEIVKIDTEVSTMLQSIQESQVRVSYTSFREYAERQKLPKEVQILCEQWLGLKRDNWSKLQSNRERAEYYNSGQWAQDVRSNSREMLHRSYMTQYQRKYQKDALPLQLEQIRGGTKSPFSYSVDRGMSTVGNIIQPFAAAGQALQGYGIWMMSGAKLQQMQPSTPNPIGFGR